jgi:hypothetical protein
VIRTTAVAVALTTAIIVCGIAVLPALGDAPAATRTLVFTSTESRRDFKAIDLPPKGQSVGDRYEFASMLHRHGRVAGRVEADCSAVDATYKALQCNLVVIRPDGSITLQGAYLNKPLPGVGGTHEEYAITGGTGAYAGATGSMTRTGNGTHDALTFTLIS